MFFIDPRCSVIAIIVGSVDWSDCQIQDQVYFIYSNLLYFVCNDRFSYRKSLIKSVIVFISITIIILTMTAASERVGEEIEALEAIFMDDISISYDEKGKPEGIEMTIFPSTANDTEKQYVCITLVVTLPELYPECEPKILLKNPRGLDDLVFNNLYTAMQDKCSEYSGQPVIYELIELVRENLTKSNLPKCQCAVCLYGFCDGDDFTKTQCFHYFHSFCLAKHLLITEKYYMEEQEKLPAWQRSTKGFQAHCPVCREVISNNICDLKKAVAPKELENAQNFSVSNELKILQAKMRALFSYQKSKGGIIDIEEEENKLLLVTNSLEESPQNDNPGPSIGQMENNSNSRTSNQSTTSR